MEDGRSARAIGAGVSRSRRELLASVGAGAVGMAGCTAVLDEDGTDSTSDDGSDADGGEDDGSGDGTWAEGGPADREGWSVTFQDDFSDGELDTDRWELGLGPPAAADCAGSGCTIEENVAVDADTERLVLTTNDDGERIPNQRWLADWTTGAVATGEAFTQAYGYFEAKVRLPVQPGGLPAFWMQPVESNPPEIDVYEVFGDRPRQVSAGTFFDCTNDGTPTDRGTMVDVERRLDDRALVFAAEWTPEYVAFFLDGEERFRLEGVWAEECLSPTPMYLILCTHVIDTDDFAASIVRGDPRDATYPYTHEIEWVRVWQREEWR